MTIWNLDSLAVYPKKEEVKFIHCLFWCILSGWTILTVQFPVKMAEQCPPWGVIDEMMKDLQQSRRGTWKSKGNQISLMTHDHESDEVSWIYWVSFDICRTTGCLVTSHFHTGLHLPFHLVAQVTWAHSDILAYADVETLVHQSTRQFLEAKGGWSNGASVWQVFPIWCIAVSVWLWVWPVSLLD